MPQKVQRIKALWSTFRNKQRQLQRLCKKLELLTFKEGFDAPKDLWQDVEEVIRQHQPEIAKLLNDDFKHTFWEQQVISEYRYTALKLHLSPLLLFSSNFKQVCSLTTSKLKQWRSQDTEVARAQELQAAEGSALRRVVLIIPRKARKRNFAFIFQLPGWALVTPLCFALQAILV